MEGHFYAGLLTFLGIVGFLLLASPTIRKELISYFDLHSASRKKEIEIPIKFRCWKCQKINTEIVKVAEENAGKRIALNCKFCTALWGKTEAATVNIAGIPVSSGQHPGDLEAY